MNLLISPCQTVLICFLVAPVFQSNYAHHLQPRFYIDHHSTIILPIQFPPYEYEVAFDQQQHHANNAKNLKTLNSRKILSSNDDLQSKVIAIAEKPVDAMHWIEQLQQKQKSANYIDHRAVAKNKNAFFDEDGNKMRLHGQQGNVLSRQFNDDSENIVVLGKKRKAKTMQADGNGNNAMNSISFAEQLFNHLAANNVAVNFTQSFSPIVQLPFVPDDIQFPYSFRYASEYTNNQVKANFRKVFPFLPHLIIINGPTRVYGDGTESKFPPILEFFVQRLQKYFSIYKYEDLSRPSLTSHTTSNVADIKNEVNRPADPELRPTLLHRFQQSNKSN